MDPILYPTYLHNGAGQGLSLPALSHISALSFVGPLLLMLQNKQTLHSGSALALQKLPQAQQSGRAHTKHAAPQVVFARTACFENCVCKTVLGDRKRDGKDDTAQPGHKYPLKGPVMALPSAVFFICTYIKKHFNRVSLLYNTFCPLFSKCGYIAVISCF